MNHILLIATILLLISSMGCVTATEETEALRSLQQDITIDDALNWIAGVTSVSGLTGAEKQRLTLKGTIPAPTCKIVEPPSMRLCADERFNWRDIGMVTPVKHQSSCGSCWAFSATGVIESAFAINAGKEIDLSEQHLVSTCCTAGTCDGGWPDWVLQYAKTTGIPDEACCPYVWLLH